MTLLTPPGRRTAPRKRKPAGLVYIVKKLISPATTVRPIPRLPLHLFFLTHFGPGHMTQLDRASVVSSEGSQIPALKGTGNEQSTCWTKRSSVRRFPALFSLFANLSSDLHLSSRATEKTEIGTPKSCPAANTSPNTYPDMYVHMPSVVNLTLPLRFCSKRNPFLRTTPSSTSPSTPPSPSAQKQPISNTPSSPPSSATRPQNHSPRPRPRPRTPPSSRTIRAPGPPT